jgi:hypothetical protein
MAINTTRKSIREAAMDDMGLYIPVAAVDDVNTGDRQVTVNKLLDASPNPEWLRDCFVTANGSDYRRVTNAAALPVLSLTDNVVDLGTGGACAIYFLLSPEECNQVIDRTLTSELHAPTRLEIPLVANQNEYAMPADLQSRADIMGLHWRDVNTATAPSEDEVASVRWLESDNGLVAHLPALPALISNVSMVVVYKKRFSALASDTATTTCPFDLAWRAVEVQLLNKLDNKFGAGMSGKFTKAWARADRELTKLRNIHMPPLMARDFTWDREWDFIDITTEILDGSW